MKKSNRQLELNEVRFANHIYEFLRFYDKQKLLNDEIAGLKRIAHDVKGVEHTYLIGKDNFSLGIKRLYAFVIDNLQYIGSYLDSKMVLDALEKLENSYYNDKRYQELAAMPTKNYEEEVEHTLKYLDYLVKSFRIGNWMCNLLQNSLMVGTRDIKKSVQYFNEREFFEHLSRYRDEVSSEISNFQLVNLFEHFKKIVAYYYTYRILLIKSERVLLDEIVEDCIDMITDRKMAELIIGLKNNHWVDQDDKEKIQEWTVRLRNVFATIYYSTNKELSNRNVLPKVHRKIFMDTSLI